MLDDDALILTRMRDCCSVSRSASLAQLRAALTVNRELVLLY